MGFSNEAKGWAQKIQDAAKAALEKARGKRRQEGPTEVPPQAPAKAPEVAEVRAEAEASTEVMDHDTVVFAAGSQTQSVKIRTEDLFRDEPVTVAPLSRHPEEDDKELTE